MGGCDTPLCLCVLVDNDWIMGLQQENSHYTRGFVHPPSSKAISFYWVTPPHTNKTLSTNNRAPTYTSNPPVSSVTGVPLLPQLPHPLL